MLLPHYSQKDSLHQDFSWGLDLLDRLPQGVRSLALDSYEPLYLNVVAAAVFQNNLQNNLQPGVRLSPWLDQVVVGDRPYLLSCLQQLAVGNTSEPIEVEYCLTYPDDSSRLVREKLWLVRDSSGIPRQINTMMMQVVEVQETATELAQVQSFLENVLDNAPVGIYIKDLEGRYLMVNQYWEFLRHRSVEEVLGKLDQEFFPPEDIAGFRASDRLVIDQKTTVTKEMEVYREDGLHSLLNTKFPLYNSQGEVCAIGGVLTDISEQKVVEANYQRLQAEQAIALEIRHINLKLQSTQKIAQIGSWDFNAITGEVSWSQEVYQLFGMDPQGQPLSPPEQLKQIHPEDLSWYAAALDRALTEGTAFSHEVRIYNCSGELRFVNMMGDALRSETGEIISLYGAVVDITARKLIELDLQEKEEFLRSIYEGIEQNIFVTEVGLDGQFRSLGWNPKTERALGVTSAAAYGKTMGEVFGEEVAAVWERDYRLCAAGEMVRSEQAFAVNDRESWTITTLNPVRDRQGRVHRIIGSTVDITAQKVAEKGLKEYEQFLQSIYDGVDLVVFVVDVTPDGRFISRWSNVKSQKFSGFIGQVGGKTTMETFGEAIASVWEQSYRHCVEAGTIVKTEEHFVRDGKEVWRWTTLNPLRDDTGRIYRLIGTATDITQRKEIELQLQASAITQAELYKISQEKTQELSQTLDKLTRTQAQLIQTEKMSSLGQMVAGVAHEINNPVNFIYGNVSHIQQYIYSLFHLVELYQNTYPQPSPEILEATEDMDLDYLKVDLIKIINSIHVGSTRIREIVKSLRTFSRLDEAEMKSIDIHENIDSTLLILQNRFKAKPHHPPIQIIKEYGTLPPVECYAGQLNQVFMNLLANAIDALEFCYESNTLRTAARTAEDHGKITISTSLLPGEMPNSSPVVGIRIRDNAQGMPPEVIDHIFDPFYTTKPVGKGTGLGLAISYQIIVEKHSGELVVTSEPGKGTEFLVKIPLKQNL